MFEVIVTSREMDGEKVRRTPILVATAPEAVTVVHDELRAAGDHAIVVEYPDTPAVALTRRAWGAFHRHKSGRILYAIATKDG
jgi:hypothetical protein